MSERNALFTGIDTTKVMVTNAFNPPCSSALTGLYSHTDSFIRFKVCQCKAEKYYGPESPFLDEHKMQSYLDFTPWRFVDQSQNRRGTNWHLFCTWKETNNHMLERISWEQIVENRNIKNATLQLYKCRRNEKEPARLGTQNRITTALTAH